MRAALCLVAGLALTACSDPRLPPPSFRNTVDTVTIFAVTGTPLHLPSGYAMIEARPVRLDQSTNADFAFQITPEGRRVLLPGWVIGHPGLGGLDPGLQKTTLSFDAIRTGATSGYISRDTIDIAAGDVFFLRSRIAPGCFLNLPYYGKMQVLRIEPNERRVVLQLLINFNCGYRSLEEGLPSG
jgi:hypothetical protein